jgi:aminoglycoside phosphotransferase
MSRSSGFPLAGVPAADTPVPAAVRRVAGERPVAPVWRNELGGLTFLIGADGPAAVYVKWHAAGTPLDLSAEADRLRWASRYATVPRVLALDADADADSEGSWLVTAALPGASAVVEPWRTRPRAAVTAIGAGLRALHDALPVADCPYDWSLATRVGRVRQAGRTDPAQWHPDHRHLSVADAFDRLNDPPSVDRLVVCHGDACSPNTLIGEDGRCCGHVDLGALGVADRWADLAVATWSAGWNYGPGWDEELLAAYGVAADPARIAYYRLLWDLSP